MTEHQHKQDQQHQQHPQDPQDPHQDRQPRIVVFLCNWCGYAGADVAGVSRAQYPTGTRIVRLMCAGRLDPALICDTFQLGADGIFVSGCHLGDCHYKSGNYHAQNRLLVVKKLIERVGLDPRRLRFEWFSANDGQRFASAMNTMTALLRSLGPNPVLSAPGMAVRLTAAANTVRDFRVRAMITREYILGTKGNVYGRPVTLEREFIPLLDEIVATEYERQLILALARDRPRSVLGLARDGALDTARVLDHVVDLRRRNMMALDRIDGTTPYYSTLGVPGGA